MISRLSLPTSSSFLCLGLFAALFSLTGCSDRAESPPRAEHPLPADVEIAACEPGRYGGIFLLAASEEPKTFNPLVPADRSSSMAQGFMNAGLTSYDPFTMSIQPGLAKRWELSQDKLSYTFYLREGLRWSDGEPFTADDVIFTFDCIFARKQDPETGEPLTDPQTGAPRWRYPNRYIDQYTIGGEPLRYEKIDRYTVRFSVVEVYSPLINDIGFIEMLPRHKLYEAWADGSFMQQWSSQTAIETPEELVGMGAFRLSAYVPGERLSYEPNPHYWRADRTGQRLPYIDRLVLRFFRQPAASMVLFANGEIDALDIRVGAAISAKDYPWLNERATANGGVLHERGASASINFLWFNQHLGSSEDGEPYLSEERRRWFTNPQFRQACLYGFNRQGVVDGVLLGRGEVLHSYISPANVKFHNPDVPRYPYDPAKARALLGEAGFSWDAQGHLRDSEGVRVSFELMLSDGSQALTTIGTTFKQNMAELGMEVRLSFVSFGVVLQKITHSFDYDMSVLGWGSSAGATDPNGSKAMLLSSGLYHVWHPAQQTPATPWEAALDEHFLAQQRTFEEAERVAHFHAIQQILAEQVPIFPMFTPHEYTGIKSRWQNVRVPPSGSLLWNLDELWTEEL